MPGMIVCIGRLRGAMQLGWPRSSPEAEAAVLQHDAGLRSARMPDPKPSNSELMKLHALPSRSTTQR